MSKINKIKFTKMNGLGNDFIILDYEEFEKTGLEASKLAEKLCSRHFAIGADGLIIAAQDVDDADAGWLFYNSDGTMPQMCGNGLRCFAKYVFDNGLVNKKTFTINTLAGVKTVEIKEDGQVRVNMSQPILEPAKIPFKEDKSIGYVLKSECGEFKINAVSMGNPHCVIFTDANTKEQALKYGPEIEKNPVFPEKTNVEFVKVISRKEIQADVWERSCGITQACGTGACASVAAGILNGLCDKSVKVNLPGGSLQIEWAGSPQDTAFDIFMTGSADYSFTGEFLIS